jgi:hypothetical protein
METLDERLQAWIVADRVEARIRQQAFDGPTRSRAEVGIELLDRGFDVAQGCRTRMRPSGGPQTEPSASKPIIVCQITSRTIQL